MGKGRKNRGNTFGGGWGTISPTFPSTKCRILGGSGGRMAGSGLSKAVGSGRRGKKGRVGEEGACAGLGHGVCRTTPPGTTTLSRQCMRHDSRVHVDGLRGARTGPLPAWSICRTTPFGATQANCRASTDGAAKRAIQRK